MGGMGSNMGGMGDNMGSGSGDMGHKALSYSGSLDGKSSGTKIKSERKSLRGTGGYGDSGAPYKDSDYTSTYGAPATDYNTSSYSSYPPQQSYGGTPNSAGVSSVGSYNQSSGGYSGNWGSGN